MTKPSIFLSSRQRDAELTERLSAALEKLGFETFDRVRELKPGDEWRKDIQAALKRSDALIMLAMMPEHLSSSWMSYEAGAAEALGKRVMLLLPNKYPVAELPADFASTRIVEFDPQAPERAARDIAEYLAAA